MLEKWDDTLRPTSDVVMIESCQLSIRASLKDSQGFAIGHMLLRTVEQSQISDFLSDAFWCLVWNSFLPNSIIFVFFPRFLWEKSGFLEKRNSRNNLQSGAILGFIKFTKFSCFGGNGQDFFTHTSRANIIMSHFGIR